MEEFIAKTQTLLSLERKAEVEQCEELLSARIIHDSKQLESKGLCMTRLSVSQQRIGLYGRSVVTFSRGSKKGLSKDLPCCRFTTGDIVGVYVHNQPLKDDQSGRNISGIVCRLGQNAISIACDTLMENLNLSAHDRHLQLVKLANDVTYKRLNGCLKCLKDAYGLPKRLFGEETLLPAKKTLSNNDGTDGGHQDSSACASTKFFNTHLNQCQRDALLFALSRQDVAIVHGPPGTGKTTTLIEIVLQHVALGYKVLACAPSNIAVDNMVERLHQQKVKIVRLGHPARLVPWIQICSLDAIMSNSDSGAIVRDVRTEINQVLDKLKQAQRGTNRRQLWKELQYLKKELHCREVRAIKEILSSADVILSTNVGASPDGPLKHLPEGHFSLVVIDECAQALEVSCWIPLLLASKCVLAGDHKQLPPTIISDQAAREGLSISLMERLDKLYGTEITVMLQVQYRMNAAIMDCPSKFFYNSSLIAADTVSDHLLSDLPNAVESAVTSVPLVFIDTSGCELYELETEDSESKGNEGEADLVLHYLKCLVEAKVELKDIAVIAPYNLQVELIRQRFGGIFDQVEVKTVDGFQGREKEAVIISLTRSNVKGEVGFLSEQRRSNVAVTRARRHLVVIGDSSTIRHETFLKELLDHMSNVGEVQSAFDYLHDTEFQQQMLHKPSKPDTTHKSIVVKKSSSTGQQYKSKTEIFDKPFIIKSTNRQVVNDVESELTMLKTRFERELLDFVAHEGIIKIDYPPSLSSLERKALHEVAEEMELEHASQGNGKDRFICVSKPRKPLVVNSPSEIDSEDDCNVSASTTTQQNVFCELDDENDVKGVRSTIKSDHSSFKVNKKPKPKKESKETRDDDGILDLCIQSNSICNYSGCKKSIKLLGQTCKFCSKLFCLSHHQAELHGCGETAKISARKELLQHSSHHKPLNPTKRAQLQNTLEKNITEQRNKRHPKKKK